MKTPLQHAQEYTAAIDLYRSECTARRSAEAPPETASPSGAFSVPGGWGSVSSDEVLAAAERHADEATRLQWIADEANHTNEMRRHCGKKAAVERLCSEVLLRHAVAMTERQPTPNAGGVPRPESALMPKHSTPEKL